MDTSFGNYLETVDNLKSRIAHLLCQLDVDLWQSLEEIYKEQPEFLEIINKQKEVLSEQEFFSKLKNTLGQAGRALMGGFKTAGQLARSAVVGPAAKYNYALYALQALSKEVNSPEVRDQLGDDQNYLKLVNFLQRIVKYLENKKDINVSMLTMQADGLSARYRGSQPKNPTYQANVMGSPTAGTYRADVGADLSQVNY